MLATETVVGGRYALGAIIGRGGGADVYRADDLETGRPVAVKVLRSATPHDLHRFELEAQTLARLDHPAIVRMCGDGEHDGIPYLILDLIDGEPLSAMIQRGALPEDEVMRIGVVLADALAHAHALGVVHRDVKPGNVLIDQHHDVHLTDFGIARLTDVTAITAAGLVIGTAAYLAPEQVEGDGATPASDIYALGLVLLEALTAERAFPGPASESAIARLHRSPVVPATTSRSLAALLTSMTASDPALRPSAAAVGESLRVGVGDTRDDATSVIPIVADETAAIPIVAAASAAPDETAPVSAYVPAPVAATTGGAAVGAGVISWLRHVDPRRALIAALVAAVLLLGLFMSVAFGGGDLKVPAGANTSATTVSTAPASTTVPPTTADTTPAAPAPKGKGHGDRGD